MLQERWRRVGGWEYRRESAPASPVQGEEPGAGGEGVPGRGGGEEEAGAPCTGCAARCPRHRAQDQRPPPGQVL